MLKSSRRVGHAKWHDHILEGAITGTKCRFPLMTRCNADVVVSGTEVEFGENFSFFEAVEEVVDEGKGVAILAGDAIEAPVVNA